VPFSRGRFTNRPYKKKNPNTKDPNEENELKRLLFWSLEFGICLEFGACDLEFHSYTSRVTRYASRSSMNLLYRFDRPIPARMREEPDYGQGNVFDFIY
jgi:hypothetical protein